MENKKKSDLLELVETAGLLLGTAFLWYLWKDISKERNEFLSEEVKSLQKENAEIESEIKKNQKRWRTITDYKRLTFASQQ